MKIMYKYVTYISKSLFIIAMYIGVFVSIYLTSILPLLGSDSGGDMPSILLLVFLRFFVCIWFILIIRRNNNSLLTKLTWLTSMVSLFAIWQREFIIPCIATAFLLTNILQFYAYRFTNLHLFTKQIVYTAFWLLFINYIIFTQDLPSNSILVRDPTFGKVAKSSYAFITSFTIIFTVFTWLKRKIYGEQRLIAERILFGIALVLTFGGLNMSNFGNDVWLFLLAVGCVLLVVKTKEPTNVQHFTYTSDIRFDLLTSAHLKSDSLFGLTFRQVFIKIASYLQNIASQCKIFMRDSQVSVKSQLSDLMLRPAVTPKDTQNTNLKNGLQEIKQSKDVGSPILKTVSWQYIIGPFFFIAALVSTLIAVFTFLFPLLFPFGLLYIPFLYVVLYYFQLIGLPVSAAIYQNLIAFVAILLNAITYLAIGTFIGHYSLSKKSKQGIYEPPSSKFTTHRNALLKIIVILFISVLPLLATELYDINQKSQIKDTLANINNNLASQSSTVERIEYCQTLEGTYTQIVINDYKDFCLRQLIENYSVTPEEIVQSCDLMVREENKISCMTKTALTKISTNTALEPIYIDYNTITSLDDVLTSCAQEDVDFDLCILKYINIAASNINYQYSKQYRIRPVQVNDEILYMQKYNLRYLTYTGYIPSILEVQNICNMLKQSTCESMDILFFIENDLKNSKSRTESEAFCQSISHIEYAELCNGIIVIKSIENIHKFPLTEGQAIKLCDASGVMKEWCHINTKGFKGQQIFIKNDESDIKIDQEILPTMSGDEQLTSSATSKQVVAINVQETKIVADLKAACSFINQQTDNDYNNCVSDYLKNTSKTILTTPFRPLDSFPSSKEVMDLCKSKTIMCTLDEVEVFIDRDVQQSFSAAEAIHFCNTDILSEFTKTCYKFIKNAIEADAFTFTPEDIKTVCSAIDLGADCIKKPL